MGDLLNNPDVRLGVFIGAAGAIGGLLLLMASLDAAAGVITGGHRIRRERKRAERIAAEPTIDHANQQNWSKYL